MSVNTIERIFWEFGASRAKLTKFIESPDEYLAKYPLTEEEREMVRTMDVVALNAYGVSSMVSLPAFQAINGGNPLMLFEFLKHLNGGKMVNRMKLPGWQFAIIRVVLGVRNTWIGLLCLLGLKKRLG